MTEASESGGAEEAESVPVVDDPDSDWEAHYDLDGEFAGIEQALDEGHIHVESTGGWMVRSDADDYFGPEVAARMAAEQQIEFREYLDRRRAEFRDEWGR